MFCGRPWMFLYRSSVYSKRITRVMVNHSSLRPQSRPSSRTPNRTATCWPARWRLPIHTSYWWGCWIQSPRQQRSPPPPFSLDKVGLGSIRRVAPSVGLCAALVPKRMFALVCVCVCLQGRGGEGSMNEWPLTPRFLSSLTRSLIIFLPM